MGGTGTALITFTLDQVSTDFGADDVAVSGGTISSFVGSGLSYTATFAPSSGFAGSAEISVDAGSFRNASEVYNASSSLSIAVDTTAPRVVSIQSTTNDGIYKNGAVIDLTVTFNEVIAVNTGGGVPSLFLETGSTDRSASFVSSSGTAASFRYIVQAGDLSLDLDIQSIDALVLNGGTVKDVVGNTANRTLMSPGAAGSLAANAALMVDTVAPTAPTALALTPVGGTVVANKISGTNTNLIASATIVLAEATGGSAMLYLDGALLATDASILSTDNIVPSINATSSILPLELLANQYLILIRQILKHLLSLLITYF